MTEKAELGVVFRGFPRTRQALFDKVVTHLITQQERSTNGIRCMYRAPNGLKCAAGCLIPDDVYDSAMEHTGWLDLASKGVVPEKNADLVSELQNIHDRFYPITWGEKLYALANKLSLVWKFGDPAAPSIPVSKSSKSKSKKG